MTVNMQEGLKQAERIQTSILNSAEKKALIWLAKRQPKWMTSDILTAIGFFGALVIAAGYVLTRQDVGFLWLASLGFVINWYGDSLDGTLARVRNTQRPVYGYYLDHTVDGINESLMFIGLGLSGLIHFPLSLGILVLYLLLTINVSVNAHLKKEFRLTYAKLGPTEFRILGIIANTLFVLIRPLREFSLGISLFGMDITLHALDLVGLFVLLLLMVIYFATIVTDARYYAKIDPPKK